MEFRTKVLGAYLLLTATNELQLGEYFRSNGNLKQELDNFKNHLFKGE